MCGFNIVGFARTGVFDEAGSLPKSLGAASQQKDQEQNRNRNSEKPKQDVSGRTGLFDSIR